MIKRRPILKQEVAMKLFPDSITKESAMQLLRCEIRRTPMLKKNGCMEIALENKCIILHIPNWQLFWNTSA